MSLAETSPQVFRLRWPLNHILRISTWVFNKLCWHKTKILTHTHTSRLLPPQLMVAPSFTSLQFSRSVVSNSLRPHRLQHARPPCPSPTPGALLKLMSIESVMPSSHLILCRPLLLLPSIFPSIRVFYSELPLRIRWPKYWSLSFNISPSNEHPGLISIRIDWFDIFAVQGTLKTLLQHHSSKASFLRCSAFFIVQLSYPYMTTEKPYL